MKRLISIFFVSSVMASSADSLEPMCVNMPDNVSGAPVLQAVAPMSAVSGNTLFTADVADAHVKSWGDDFNQGIGGWTMTAGSGAVEWSAKASTGDKAFSAIDADDVKSLYVEGPYQTFKREVSSLTSGSVSVPYGARLSGWVGFSKNYNSYCRLLVEVSDDDFATSTEVWNSTQADGATTWQWHSFEANLDEWAGRDVKLRLTYSWGTDDAFQTGGYMGSFYVDNLAVSGLGPVDNVAVNTGETVRFVALAPADSYNWTFGDSAVPSTSTEASPVVYYTAPGNYNVSLQTPDASYTQPSMVTVAGTAPVARIGAPASFRFADTRNLMVAPLAPVTFTDMSDGFPTSRTWSFTGVTDGDNTAVHTTDEESPVVNYMYQHAWDVNLAVANSSGESATSAKVSAEYSGVICNWYPDDYITHFDMEDWGHFPGSTTDKVKMTMYAERFSAPSTPMVVGGVYLYFTTVDLDEDDVTAQIQNLGVHLYTSENGQPGERIESWWWQCNELDYTPGGTTACWFPFTYTYTGDDGLDHTYMPPVVNDEFFIVVDGFPVTTDKTQVTLGMATWRGEGNTAYIYKDKQWMSADSYFGDNRHTSLAVMPSVVHSVMTLLPVGNDCVTFGRDGGERSVDFFSYLGWNAQVECDADWCRVTNEPSGYTLDKLAIACDPLEGGADREATLKITDTYNAGTYEVTVRQSASTSSIDDIAADTSVALAVVDNNGSVLTVAHPADTKALSLTDVSGRVMLNVTPAAGSTSTTVNVAGLQRGVYILFSPRGSVKVVL